MIYIADTNFIADLINLYPPTVVNVQAHKGDLIYICQPVHYEALRGLLRSGATAKMRRLDEILQNLTWLEVTNGDWLQAARFWATMTTQGRQFSDVDLLIGALAQRLNATIITADDDFDALPVQRENWRTA